MNFTEFLSERILRTRLKGHRILVVFDPEGRYEAISNSLADEHCKMISSAGRPRRLPASIKPPNIILLLGDDHGWEETGYKQASPRANPDAHAMTPSGVFARTA